MLVVGVRGISSLRNPGSCVSSSIIRTITALIAFNQFMIEYVAATNSIAKRFVIREVAVRSHWRMNSA